MSDFNFDALNKAAETGILNKDDFSSDENWASALDAFTEQLSLELEVPDLSNLNNELTDFSDIVPGYGEDFFNPYDNYLTIDDTEYPLAHGQLLPHLSGKVTPDVIFQLGQGNFDALENIEDDSIRNWASSRMEVLGTAGAWGEDWASKHYNPDPFADTWNDGTY